MVKLEATIIASQEPELVAKFLVDIFEMEIVDSCEQEIELSCAGGKIKLVRAAHQTTEPILFFYCNDLVELREMVQRVEFFYFTNEISPVEKLFCDRLAQRQEMRLFSPDGRGWDIFFVG